MAALLKEPLLREELDVVHVARALIGFSASLSLACSLFLIGCFVLFQDSRRCGRRIMLCLSVADLGSSIAWLLTFARSTDPQEDQNETATCHAQGYLLVFFMLASCFWTSCFAFHLFQILGYRIKTPELYERRYHVIAWGIPAMIVLHFVVQMAAGFDLIGQSGLPWCWIRSWSGYKWSVDAFRIQLMFFYVPVLACFVNNIMIYMALLYKVGDVMSTRMEERIWKRMLAYTCVFFLSAVCGVFGRIYQAFSPNHALSIRLLYVTCFFMPLQGATNCFAYGMNEKLRARVKTYVSAAVQRD